MTERSGESIAARLVPSSVVHLHPEEAVLEAMLRGWGAMAAWALAVGTIENRLKVIRQFLAFSGDYPWQWGPEDVDEWSSHLRTRVG